MIYKTKAMNKQCIICSDEYAATTHRSKFCSDECKLHNRFLVKQTRLISSSEEGVAYVIDKWNNYATPRIYGRWMAAMHPGKTSKDYLKDFPNAPLSCEADSTATSKNSGKHMKQPKYRKMAADQVRGKNNPNHKSNTTLEERQARSPFSTGFSKYESIEEAKAFQNEHCHKGIGSNKIEYWTNLGHTETEAKELVKERQATFTLEKCIKRHGKVEGTKIFEERQRKWKSSLQKNFEKYGDGRSPSSQFASSMIESICNELQMDIPKKEKYIACKETGRAYSYDFTHKERRKIIEFNGDYWHCNPKVYTADYFHKNKQMTAEDIWEYDKVKTALAENYNYQVLSIWELDWNKDPKQTLKKCIKFLND